MDIDTASGQQLFVRWLSMGVFLPYMRVHGSRTCNIPTTDSQAFANPCPNEPWSYGPENFIIIKKYIALRYQLVPYVKKLFAFLQSSGQTIMRPLYYDFSSDSFIVKATGDNDPSVIHQFMFGPRLLVAPVGIENATIQEVYLPRLPDSFISQKFKWTHWWTDKDFGTGGNSINISAPLDQIPVFYLGSKEDILSGNI